MIHPLLEYVQEKGPISLKEYMQLALMHPNYGYYQKNTAIGAAGDFITSPEISQVFGEMVGVWMADLWQRASMSEAAVVELGPGQGTLMKDLLRATRRVPKFHERNHVYLIETSVRMRKAQKLALEGEKIKIFWHLDIHSLPEKPLFIIANEFFDALPIRQFEKKDDKWFERMVSWNKSQRKFLLEQAEQTFDMSGRNIPEEAQITEICEDGEAIMQKLCAHIKKHGGAMLVVDYGYEGGSRIDTLQAMRKHAYADILEKPGESDITAHVDIDALRSIAEKTGLATEVSPQGRFLLELGVEIRAQALCKALDEKGKNTILNGIARLVSPHQMGTLFKVLSCVHPNIEQ